jgi:hypothetical protein
MNWIDARGEALVLALGPAFGYEAIADPRFGLDVLPAGFGFQLFANLPNEHAQILWLVR